MRTFVQALGGDELEAPAGTMHTLDGVLFVPTVHLSAAIRLLDKLLTINVDAYNVVGKLARAEALAQAGNVNEAVAALAPLERELACEAVLGSKGKHGGEFEALPCQTVMGSWLGPEIKAKVLATKAKMLARAGRRGEALEALRQVEDMKTVAGRDVVAWDLAEVGIVLGDGDRAERYCDIVRQRLQGALAEARRASLVVGRTCGSKMVRS